MNIESEFIDWIKQLDEDLDRDEYDSYELDDDGRIVYVDLQESQLDDDDLARVAPLTRLKHLNISGNVDVTDAGLVHLARLTELAYLDVGFTSVGDDGLDRLVHLRQLRTLILNGLDDDGQLTDAGLRRLLPLDGLEQLRLNGADITDASVDTLMRFTKLTTLDVSQSKVSDAGFHRLEAGLPGCKVMRGYAA